MPLTSLKIKFAPVFAYGGLLMQFDAVLEDTLEESVTLSDYPLEVGVSSNDHRFINPAKWRITGAVSDNPLKFIINSFSGDLTELVSDTGEFTATGALMSGWLTQLTGIGRSLSALDGLISLMKYGEPFSVYTGDRILTNMVIERVTRTKAADNENTLIFTAELREWQSIETAISNASSSTQATTGTDTASAASNLKAKGEQIVSDITDAATELVDSIYV